MSLIRVAPWLLVLAVASSAQREAEQDGCSTCHGKEERSFEQSVHAAAGIDCVMCHGGDASSFDKDVAHGADFRVRSGARATVELCGDCHSDPARTLGYGVRTDQVKLYWTSPHGQALAENDDQHTATCVSCHGDHAIYRSTDPRSSAHKFNQPETCGRCHEDASLMEDYGLSPGVVEEYKSSVHGEALLQESRLSSPACTDCHGSHGATPPRVAVLGRVCGHCHSVVQRYFEESPHMGPVHEGVMEECISCHGSHSVQEPNADMFRGRGAGNCATCHGAADTAALEVARSVADGLSRLDASIVEAEDTLRAAASRGLFLQEEHGYLADARSLRGRARSMTHTLSPLGLADVLNRGQAVVEQTYESLGVKERALRDRKIFTAILLVILLLLAAVLQVYRREVYGPMSSQVRG